MGIVWSLLQRTFFAPRQIEGTKCSGSLEFVKSHWSALSYMINIEDELLPTLLSIGVLKHEQFDKVQGQANTFNKLQALYPEILSALQSDIIHDRLLHALDTTHHKHVSNFIRGKGNYQQEFGNDWPLGGKELSHLDNGRNEVVNSMDSILGLLDEMFTLDGISIRLKRRLESMKDPSERNEHLCTVLRRNSRSTYLKFIECLKRTEQHQCVSMISPDDPSGVPPLNKFSENLLKLNYAVLTKMVDTRHELLAVLYSLNCITQRQRNFLESIPNPEERAGQLLDMVMRGSQSGYAKFIDCLNKTNQQHVSRILQQGNILIELVARIDCAYGESKAKQEKAIVDALMALISMFKEELSEAQKAELVRSFSTSFPEVIREELSAMLMDQIKWQLTAVVIGNSIHLIYSCESLAMYEKLHQAHSSEQLASELQTLFNLLLSSSTDKHEHVSLSSLTWPASNRNNCIRHLCEVEKLTTLAEVYEMAQSRHVETMCDKSLDEFPIELREVILMRAAGVLFSILSKHTHEAHIYSCVTLCAVSKEWDMLLTNRKFNKRVLKKTFKHILHPFKRYPRQLFTIRCQQNVCGIAELKGKIYVAYSESNTIHVYTNSKPFHQLNVVTEVQLRGTIDIIACSETNQLFVAVTDVPAIWRIKVTDDGLNLKEAEQFFTESWQPLSLSVKSARLLVTPNHGESLYHFHTDGKPHNCIALPDFMNATHAVEILHGPQLKNEENENDGIKPHRTTAVSTYIVCYRPRKFGDSNVEHNSVSEVSDKGEVIRRLVNPYDGSDVINFNLPYYLSLDADGHVFVADVRNERVVVVDVVPSRLHVKRVLLTSLGGQPRRLCFSRETGLLYVINWYSANITVFSVLQKKNRQTRLRQWSNNANK